MEETKKKQLKQRKTLNPSPTPVLPKQLTLEDIKNEKIEIPITWQNIMLGYLTTDFNREDYYKIFDEIIDLPYPILVDPKTNMPLLDDKNEPMYDLTDYETNVYNLKQKKCRLIAMLKLFGHGFEWSDNDEENLDILSQMPSELYNLLEQKVSEILNYKFIVLEQKKQSMLRGLISASALEASIRKKEEDKIKKEIDVLINEVKLLKAKHSKSENEIDKKKIVKQIEEKENQIEELSEQISTKRDGYSLKHGVKHTGLIMNCAKEYSWGYDLTMGYLNNRLTEEQTLYCSLCLTSYTLNNEYERDLHKDLEKKYDKDKKG